MSRSLVDDNYKHCRKEFTSVSIGTEEELGGPCLVVPFDAPKRIGIVESRGTGDVLVEITTDLRVKGRDNAYKIELKTTPVELDDWDAWLDRRRAVQTAVWYLESAGGRELANDCYKSYQTTILCPGVRVDMNSAQTIRSSDRQATVGIPATEFGVMPVADLLVGKLHRHVTLPWYRHRFEQDFAASDLSPLGRICYAFLISAMLKAAQVVDEFKSFATADAKNRWVVRPCTPPIKILGALDSTDEDSARISIEGADIPALLPGEGAVPSPQAWDTARERILSNLPLGGHMPPDAWIGNDFSMLFEYRTLTATQFPLTRWDPDEISSDDIPEPAEPCPGKK